MNNGTPAARILIIDDEEDLSGLLAIHLKQRGYETDTASSGAEGLAKLGLSRYHLVISDIRMPGLSGIDTLEAIKRVDPHIEVVLMTAYGSVPTAVEALKLGAYDFLEKPFSLEKIFMVVDGALDRRKLKTLKGLEETARAIFSTARLSDLVPMLADLALNVAPSEESFMVLPKDGRMEVSAWSSVGVEAKPEGRLGLAEVVLKEGELSRIFCANPPNDPRFHDVPEIFEVNHLLAFPFKIDERSCGVLGISRTRGSDPFSAADTHNFSLFAALVAEAVRAATLYSALEQKIGELQEAENKVVQSEKMAALGRISAGLAHELKSPVGGIQMNVEYLMDRVQDAEQLEVAKTIWDAARRCCKVIDNLMGYSRAASRNKSDFDISELVERSLGIVEEQMGWGQARLFKNLGSRGSVRANTTQIQQVLINILQNAIHAMPTGGALWVRTMDLTAKRGTLAQFAAPGGAALLRDLKTINEPGGQAWVVIEVQDQGVGIRPEDLPRLFEPFFTTKEEGKGTGLGLYLSYEIVSVNGGVLWASSAGPGKGASFFVALPVVAAPLTVGLDQVTSKEAA